MRTPSRHLYLRVWLAAVLALALVMVLAGVAWHIQQRDRDRGGGPIISRMLIVRNTDGDVLAVAPQLPRRGQGYEFQVVMPNGQEFYLQVPRTTPGGPPPQRALPPWWARSPYGFLWTLLLVGMVVALALYPVIRRLTLQLERLQNGVKRWGEGDLNVRFPVQGQDEVADLSRRFNEAADRIQSLMTSQKSLLANASHELRSPLARIRMAMELMDSPKLDDAVRQRTRAEVLRNMGELDQLIDEILLASRLDAKEADIGTIESVELVGLCAEECARVGANLDVPEGQSSFEVQGVSKLLRRLVRNLLENAKRYGATAVQGDESDIELSLRHENGRTVLRVSDRGPGVPSELRERIFEPFYRLPGASERVGGVGLGLSLVKSIAERHGGSIRCEDREGGGARFVVTL
jgi:two-component system, OmpR family, sensor kinase